MRVGIDIDGVLYPWEEAARDAVVAKFGGERLGPSLSWEWLRENLPPEQWAWLCTAEGQQAAFGAVGRTYPDVVPAFRQILKAGHACHFVTHRDPRRTAVNTAAFLHLHFKAHPWAGVHVIQNSVPKWSLMEWDAFIDDKPATVLEMLEHTGAVVFAPARSWNVELAALRHPRFLRYEDPQVVADVIRSGW